MIINLTVIKNLDVTNNPLTYNKIAYEDINSGRVNQYIIKSIDIDLNVGGTQQVNAIKFYPLYPEF